jgi:hypothetical protein
MIRIKIQTKNSKNRMMKILNEIALIQLAKKRLSKKI